MFSFLLIPLEVFLIKNLLLLSHFNTSVPISLIKEFPWHSTRCHWLKQVYSLSAHTQQVPSSPGHKMISPTSDGWYFYNDGLYVTSGWGALSCCNYTHTGQYHINLLLLNKETLNLSLSHTVPERWYLLIIPYL